MHITPPKSYRKLVPGRCRYCDRQFFYRQPGRPKFFCDNKCKKAEFRHTRYLGVKRHEIAPKTPIKPKASKAGFGDRPLPLNLLGGHRWPSSTSVDSDTISVIVSTEVGSTTNPILTTDQQREAARLIDSIPDDLSIPQFLRRSSS